MPSTTKRRPHIARANERYRTHALASLGGSLVDLSASGMRVRVGNRPGIKAGDMHTVEIKSTSQSLRLRGQVVWVRRSNLLSKTHELGIRFVDARPAIGKVLEHWAVYGYIPSRDTTASSFAAKSGSAPSKAASVAHRAGDIPCFYETLGVTPDACQAEIHAAYRRLAKTLHPDICRDEDAADRFAFVARVYQVLGDPASRRKYDEAVARRTASVAA